ALARHFGAEIAEEAAALKLGAHHQVVQRVEVAPQALERLDGRIAQNVPARAAGRVALDDRGAERLLAVEVVVERALGYAGRVGDLLHANAVEALLEKALHSGFDDLFAHAGSRHAGINMTGRLKCQAPDGPSPVALTPGHAEHLDGPARIAGARNLRVVA